MYAETRMNEVEDTFIQAMGLKNATVSILDESLFTGPRKVYKLLCSVDSDLITIAAVDAEQNKFTGFEGFRFAKPLGNEQLAQKVSELTHMSSILKKVDFAHASVQFSGSRFTFIPAALFRAGDAPNYFYFNNPQRGGESLHHEDVRGYDAVNIFSVPGVVVNALKKLFEKFTVHHRLTVLLDAARLSSLTQPGKSMFLHVRGAGLDVVVVEDRKLLFANAFTFKSVEDAVYYVMMVCSQLLLDPEKANVVLSGELDKDESLVSHVRKYIRHLTFGERTKAAAFTYGFDTLPPHYYHAAFSHILCES
jgi:hypothetical protein